MSFGDFWPVGKVRPSIPSQGISDFDFLKRDGCVVETAEPVFSAACFRHAFPPSQHDDFGDFITYVASAEFVQQTCSGQTPPLCLPAQLMQL